MKIFIIFYLIQIFTFQTQAIHLCEKEDANKQCTNCVPNSKLENGICKCLDGYVTHEKVNKCYPCLPNCKECNPFQLDQCEKCFGENNNRTNQCICNQDFIFYAQGQTCIPSNKNLDLYHLNFLIQQKTFEKSRFDFCQNTSQFAQIDSLYLLQKNNTTETLDKNFTKLNNQIQVAFKSSNETLVFNKYLNEKIKLKNSIIKDENEIIFEINSAFGFSDFVGNKDDQNLILIIEMKNIITNSYYFLLMQCQSQKNQSIEEQKFSENNVNQIVDTYFNLFYQCPSNCVKCKFENLETELNVQCQKCINGMKIQDGKCIYESKLIKMMEIKENNDEKDEKKKIGCDSNTYLKDDNYCTLCNIQNCLICETETKCKTCEQEDKFYLKEDKCQCKKDEDCQINQPVIKNCKYFKDNICWECEQNYYLYKNQCYQMLSNENLICIKEEKCVNCLNMKKIDNLSLIQDKNHFECKCKDRYFIDYQLLQCKQCDKNCKNCADRSNKCINCKDGLYLENQKCKQCPETCRQCDSMDKCKNCQDGYYLDESNSQCKQCNIKEFGVDNDQNVCEKCLSEQVCEKAKEGYYIDEVVVKKCNINKCKQCEKTECKQCEPEYYVEKGQCDKCSTGCLSCEKDQESNQIKCLKCDQGFSLSDEKVSSCQICPDNCQQCPNKSSCNKCKDGFKLSSSKKCVCKDDNQYFKDGICQTCIANCEKCKSQNQCEVCHQKYDLNEKQECVKKKCKITNCEECNDESSCEKCTDSIFDQENKICGCKNNCEKCSLENEKQKCSSCKQKFYLGADFECKSCTDKNCQNCDYSASLSSDQCLNCQEGYSLKENKCYKQNNLFPLLSLVFIIALIYGAYYFKDQILSLCANKDSRNFSGGIELPEQEKNNDQKFNILDD
ncbi:unnamed protein product [Paramecium sonneborni]|uniref:EGF-like domain-containing protein n=1 Tax=Paramecium sonneborni TaxID=65129 RepID=A0A8S1P3J0_9CILI|nr:unnamed protein product [Paramecium sonneborni]